MSNPLFNALGGGKMPGAKRLMPMKRLKHSYIRELLPFQV